VCEREREREREREKKKKKKKKNFLGFCKREILVCVL
jgi:hypothetical protein